MQFTDDEVRSLIANSIDVSTRAQAMANGLEPLQEALEAGRALAPGDAAELVGMVREANVRTAQSHALMVAMLTAAHERARGQLRS